MDRDICTALIPHGNIISRLLYEQNALVRYFSTVERRAGFTRFMPLCLFTRENFETAARICAGGKRENAAPSVIMPPVFAHGMIVYPVKLGVNLTPVMPPFFERCLPDDLSARGKNICGIITVFASVPSTARAVDFSRIMQSPEQRITVFKLCQIDFRAAGSRIWEWKINQTKWIKLGKQ
ncbi:MAG: hypothetical protein Pg6C_20930 [Treponemataceae bacterium]|nr:MAG: hypothetical protein Pg6C_20930 [Treponemataceae bacterium]